MSFVAQKTIRWVQVVVTLTAATSAQLIVGNTARRGLRWMNVGLNPCTIVPGTVTVIAGTGMNYNGATGTGFQGGSDSFFGEVSTQPFSAISTLGTTVVIWEGL